jgi:hypothetical protein
MCHLSETQTAIPETGSGGGSSSNFVGYGLQENPITLSHGLPKHFRDRPHRVRCAVIEVVADDGARGVKTTGPSLRIDESEPLESRRSQAPRKYVRQVVRISHSPLLDQ